MSLEILTTTVLKRPYVVIFLLSYLFIAARLISWRWALLFMGSGYGLAFFSEFLSINYGFPYGWYFYKYENLQGEWLFCGVPVWDSVSYVFMNFAGLCVARLSLKNNVSKTKLLFLSAFFVLLLDVVIDPVAHLGAQWFLGDIYYYPNPGFYFDVTLANFAGWFVTSLAINGVGIFILGFCKFEKLKWSVFCMGLYYGIFAFGFAIAIYLQEWLLVVCDLLWIGLTLVILRRPLKN